MRDRAGATFGFRSQRGPVRNVRHPGTLSQFKSLGWGFRSTSSQEFIALGEYLALEL